MYDFVGQNSLPPHMSHYGLASAASPRPGSAYGQPTYDESFNIDGELYDPDVDPEYYIPDQNLIQEWPFGHKPGLEGKSTITYTPQQQVRGLNPQNAGMFANALRGPSIQYGAGYPSIPPPQPPPAQLPGPGFFSQNNQQMQGSTVPTQAGVLPGSFGSMARPGMTASPAAVPPAAMGQKVSTTIQSSSPKPAAPMMPPNAVIPTQSSEAKPKLIPGSVGVPVSSVSQSPGGTTVSKSMPVSMTASSIQMPQSQGGAPKPGPASSLLSTLASKHQEEANKAASSTNPASATVPTSQKTVVQGFTFTTTPKITQPTEEPKKKEEKQPIAAPTSTAAKPFSGFSFTSPAKPSTPSGMSSLGALTSFSQAGSAGLPFGQQSPAPSFATLASQLQTSPAFQLAAGDQKGFAGTGTPLFGKSPSPRRRNTSAGSDDHVEEYEPNVDFKPVIQLPDLVEVKTGEEDEERLFCERAKLFRFDNEANQWKERGVGEMKILRHKESKSTRILMRREQVLKLCANHKISADLKLTPMSSSDKAWVWNAMDFSDGEMKSERLAVKFKTSDIADKFRKVFESSQADLDPKNKDSSDAAKKETEAVKPKTGPLDTGKCDLAELFKPKAGSWTCDGCFVNNAADVLKCPCCQTLKPGVKQEDIKPTASSGKPLFGGQATGQSGFKFGADAGSSGSKPQTGTGFQFGSKSTAPASGFTFGSPAVTTAASTKTDTPSASGFVFGSPATTTQTGTTKPTGFVFGQSSASSSSSGFKFGSSATSVSSSSTTTSTVATTESGSQPAKGLFSSPATTTTSSGFALTSKPFAFGSSTGAPGSTSSILGSPATGGLFGSKPTTEADTKSPASGLPSAGTAQSKPQSETKSGIQEVANGKTDSRAGESLLARYLSSPDNWKCKKCQANNDGLSEKCSSCGSENSVDTETDGSSNSTAPQKPVVGATSTPPGPFMFGQSASSKNSPSSFNFGVPKSSSEGFKFTFAPASDTQKTQPAASIGSGFNFTMSMTPMKSPLKSPNKGDGLMSPKSPEVNEEGYYVNRDDDDSHIHFEPVITLPERVDVKTGEEDEEVVFSHRAKLYRFINGEWKERGLGDVKVLYNSASNKARILMRREQILKLCCNHYITPELKFQPMPNSKGCALVWYAMDFADEEPKTEQFSIKFKNEDAALKFQKAVEDVKAKLMGARPKTTSPPKMAPSIPTVVETVGATETSMSGAGDVEIVRVEEATPEEVAKARQLKLPDHFYLYLRQPGCPGCIGCTDEIPQVGVQQSYGRQLGT